MSETDGETGSEGLDRRTFSAGETVFKQDEDGAAAYLIVDGEVEVFRGKGGREVGLATLGRGDIFGEMSLIDGKPRAATARAVGDVEVLVVKPDDMDGRLMRLAETDSVMRRLIDVFVQRLRGQLARLD